MPEAAASGAQLRGAVAPRSATRSSEVGARRMAVLVVVGLVALAVLLAVGFGAKLLQSATIALVAAGGALVFCLHRLYRLVQAVSRPVAETTIDREVGVAVHGVRALREERRRLLRAINELKFDFAMGKLSEDDYRVVREGYELRAVEVMRALESEPELDPQLAQALKQRSSDSSEADEPDADEGAPPSGADEDEADSPAADEHGVCRSCDKAIDPDARFCKYCGAEVQA